MTRLVAFFLDRPLFVKMIIFAVFVLGIQKAYNIQKEGFPNITFKNIFITTIYPGASAIDVEKNVTVIIEEKLKEVVGIQELTSTSQDSISTIIAEVDENASDTELKEIYNDIDSTVGQIEDLPGDLDGSPVLELRTSHDVPIVEVALLGEFNELKRLANHLKERISLVPEVTQVDTVGLSDDEVHILIDPKKARRYQIGLRSISNSIRLRNIEGSGGTLESFLSEKKVVSVNKFEHPKDVLNTYLRVSDLGHALQLKEIATVKIVPKEENLRVRNNGRPGISLLVTKSAKADIVETIDKIKETVAQVKKPEGVDLVYLNDQSQLTRNRLNLVSGNAMVGFALVLIILFLVFNWKMAAWTAFGIPFSFLGALILLGATNETLNMLTLGGFIIVLGMLVDDAIVVAENIQAYREKGMSSYQACIQGVKTVWLPVLSASLTTMVAFTPMLSFGGLPGQFIYIVPLIVILALGVSLFDSYFILPAHLLDSREGTRADKAGKRYEKKAFVIQCENLYKKLLTLALRNKFVVLLAFISLFILSILGAKLFVKKEAFPQDASEGFNIQYQLDRGASFEKNTEFVKKIEKHLLALSKEELVGFSARLGTQSISANTERGSQHNIGIIFVYLTSYSERGRNAQEIMDDLRLKFDSIPGLGKQTNISFELTRIGPPLGKPFEIRVASYDDDLRGKKADEIKKFVSSMDGVFEVEDDDLSGKDELNVKINHKTLHQAGLTIEDVLQTLRIAFDGQVITNMVTKDKTLDFRLRLDEWGRADINFIKNLPIQNRNGFLVNLDQFVSGDIRPGKSNIKHLNHKRTTTVYGNIDTDKISGAEVITRVNDQYKGDQDYQIKFAGEPVEQGKIFGNIGGAALLAIIGVYIIISLVFNSLSQPLIIILSIPLGLIGIVFAALTHGAPLSMFAGIAMVGLTGVIVNDAIVMVHTIKEKTKGKKSKKKLSDAVIIEGAVGRLRPILLTTITTVMGIFPTAYGIGGTDPFISQMCLFLGYGLLFGTFIILYLIPVLFSIMVSLENFLFAKRKSLW